MPRGRSATSARSDSSEMDIDGAEPEITKLQRQFKIMQGDQQAYSIQTQEQIRKQQQEIDKLLKEQEELHRNLGVSKSLSRQQQDNEDTHSLRALLEQRDMVEEEMKKETQCQKELEKEISNLEMKLAELRKGQVNTHDAHRSEVQRTQKAIRTLEYKLDRALTRFNEQLNKNSQLRQELQILHIERVRFQKLHSRLEKELQEIQKKIGETINLSTAAYDARVEAQSKMSMMREKAVKDLGQYNAEMKELERLIAHECNLKDFMTTKCSERTGQDDVHEIGHRRLSVLKEQKRMESGEESLDVLEEVFERIRTVTGEDNLDILLNKFIQDEGRNFALFNFFNEQNDSAEALRGQIRKIQGEMEQFQLEDLQQEQAHRSLLRDIDEQQKETKSKAEDYENQANLISKILEETKTGLSSIFSKIECDRSIIEDMGSSTGISENNIMSYLGLVEQKTNELLTIRAFLNFKDVEKDFNPKHFSRSILGQNTDLLQQQKVSYQAAVKSMDCDADEYPLTDEEERPLSQKELRKRIMKGVLQQ